MGRDARLHPSRILHMGEQLLSTKRIPHQPPWLTALQTYTPNEPRLRPVMRVENINAPFTSRRKNKRIRAKSSKMFQPVELEYTEDKLRDVFFNDHPWELARPRVVLESTGNDSKKWDWSQIKQLGKPLDGESVVQRQKWLIENYKPSEGETLDMQDLEERAYDIARKEFYKIRQEQDVERQVAKEEAMFDGAYFNTSELERSFEWENKRFETFRKWAIEQSSMDSQRQAGEFRGTLNESDEATIIEEASTEQELASVAAEASRNR